MKTKRFSAAIALWTAAAFLVLNGSPSIRAAGTSEWVHAGPDGKLAYKTTERGDKIVDFSHAGYGGGGVALPNVPEKIKVPPTDDDGTAAIQEAIDKVSAMELKDGVRGAVVLSATTYTLNAPLRIDASGVVLRGSGNGEGGTGLKLTGDAKHAINIGTKVPEAESLAERISSTISNDYVPSGAVSFEVKDGSGFKEGDTIHVVRPVTDSWLAFMGMDQLGRKGKKQTWLKGETKTERRIAKIDGNKITLDVPLTDSYDAKYLNPPGASILKVATPNRISNVGVENLRIVAPPQNVPMNQARYAALTTSRTLDGWVRDVTCVDTVNSIKIGDDSRRITLQKVEMLHGVPTIGAARPADWSIDGSQVLLDRCTAQCENIFFVVTGPRVSGPNAVVNGEFKGRGSLQPHQRWATGLLFDNCTVERGIDFMNRGSMGTGQGWSVGWAVAWNCKANSYTNQMPPGAVNWVIGSTGKRVLEAQPFNKEPKLPEGIFDSHGTAVEPKSLYLAQLEERLGKDAIKNIGY